MLRVNNSDASCTPSNADFVVAGGRVCGTEHVRTGRSCQDAFAWQWAGECLLAVVCDGCGSGRFSEVGAILGSRLWTAALADIVRAEAICQQVVECPEQALLDRLQSTIWPAARSRVREQLSALAVTMGGALADVILDHFLFTVVGALVSPAHTMIYSLGDGVYGLNEEICEIGPFTDNRPPYLGYDLVENRSVYPLEVHVCLATERVRSLLLATDGISPLLAPDLPADAGALQFTAPGFVRNRDAIRRRLAVLNRERRDIDWDGRRVHRQSGLFSDDVAVITVQRRAQEYAS